MQPVGHDMLYLLERSDNNKTHTFIGTTTNFEQRLREHNNTYSAHWAPVLLLKLPTSRECSAITLRDMWKRNARGLTSRVNYGLKIAKKTNAVVYIHTTDTPILNTLNAYPGEPKDVPASFWKQF